MQYRRYGKFDFRNYYCAWFAISFLLIIIVSSLGDGMDVYLIIWPTVLVMIMIWGIIEPNTEYFSISAEAIEIKKKRKSYSIHLPQEGTLIISYADICPTWVKRMGVGNSAYILKGKYAVSILRKMPTENILSILHGKYTFRYTNCLVEQLLKEDFIYSFVGEQNIVEKILVKKNYTLILPETLANKIDTKQFIDVVHIDKGY